MLLYGVELSINGDFDKHVKYFLFISKFLFLDAIAWNWVLTVISKDTLNIFLDADARNWVLTVIARPSQSSPYLTSPYGHFSYRKQDQNTKYQIKQTKFDIE